MKIVLILIVLIANQASGQILNYVLVDKDNKVTEKVNKAAFVIAVKKISDSSFERLEYHFAGPKMRSFRYTDPEMKIKTGQSTLFDDSGHLVIKGAWINNKKSGTWTDYRNRKEILYLNDSLVSEIPFDSKKNTLDPNRPNKIEIESSFPGGSTGYRSFLTKNMTYPERALKMAMQGQVVIDFMVDTLGKALNGEINRSVEISLDEEALRLLGVMPSWSPAILDGAKVKSYKRQPITFSLSR